MGRAIPVVSQAVETWSDSARSNGRARRSRLSQLGTHAPRRQAGRNLQSKGPGRAVQAARGCVACVASMFSRRSLMSHEAAWAREAFPLRRCVVVNRASASIRALCSAHFCRVLLVHATMVNGAYMCVCSAGHWCKAALAADVVLCLARHYSNNWCTQATTTTCSGYGEKLLQPTT